MDFFEEEMYRFSKEEFEKKVYFFSKRKAIKAKPEYTLEEILNKKTAGSLKSIAKLNLIQKVYSFKKKEVISILLTELIKKQRIEAALISVDSKELKEIIKISEVDKFECTAMYIMELGFFVDIGIIYLYYHEDKFFLVMPTEIKEIVKEIYNPSFIKAQKRIELLSNYLCACSNLYGLIEVKEFIKIFNSQNSPKTNTKEIFDFFAIHKNYSNDIDDDDCFLWDGYIVACDLQSDGFEGYTFKEPDVEGIQYLIEATEGKPRYIPTKKELLKYAESCYYEKTKYTNKLQELIYDCIDEVDVAEEVVDTICMLATLDAEITNIMHVLEKFEIEFYDEEDYDEFLQIIVDLKNNSRIRENKGYTPEEMMKMSEKVFSSDIADNVIPFNVFREAKVNQSQKVGRNDPCPCGSGKKHKKCCGKNNILH